MGRWTGAVTPIYPFVSLHCFTKAELQAHCLQQIAFFSSPAFVSCAVRKVNLEGKTLVNSLQHFLFIKKYIQRI